MAKRRSRGEGSLYQRQDGMWVAQLYLPDGKKKVKYSKRQKVVQDWMINQRKLLSDGIFVKNEKISFGEFLDNWLENSVKPTVRPKTFEGYEATTRVNIKPGIGYIRLSELRPDHLQAFYNKKLEDGKARRTVQLMHTIIHRALEQALRWGLVTRNVSDLVDPPSPARKSPSIWTAEQVKTFLGSVKDHRFYLIYLLAISCGFREGEVLGIHFEDVDIKNRVVNVRHAVQSLKRVGLVVTEPKTDRAKRPVTVPDFALVPLREYVERNNRNRGLMFTTSTGKPISPRNLVRHFKQALVKAGLPDIRFHDLRHTHCSLLLAAGVNPKVVHERVGHSTVMLTLDTYSHVIPSLQEDAADKINAILS